MFKRFLIVFGCIFLFANNAQACDSCGCVLSRLGSKICATASDKPFYFDFTVEQQNWNTENSRVAHNLHHNGHHVHNKTHEEFYHFSLGTSPVEKLHLLAEIPYVHRSFTELDNHAILGNKESTEGWGDLKISGLYKVLETESGYVGPMAGVKFPTGSTSEENSVGTLAEMELQPGSGSYDYSVGGGFGWSQGLWSINGNMLYTLKTEGDHDFEFGDVLSSYVFLAYDAGQLCKMAYARIGLDVNFQLEDKQNHLGHEIADSGGALVLMGPAVVLTITDRVALTGNFLLPVYQDMGGVHQELDFVWHAGARIKW